MNPDDILSQISIRNHVGKFKECNTVFFVFGVRYSTCRFLLVDYCRFSTELYVLNFSILFCYFPIELIRSDRIGSVMQLIIPENRTFFYKSWAAHSL